MSKITFRADDDLVESVEALDASKSEVMRRALRAYLDGQQSDLGGMTGAGENVPVDELIAQRVDQLVTTRLAGLGASEDDFSVNVSVEPDREDTIGFDRTNPDQRTQTGIDDVSYPLEGDEDEQVCSQCGTAVRSGFVYCPNCGEKISQRAFCDCGAEIRSDWSFCPHCGRRTASAEVLER